MKYNEFVNKIEIINKDTDESALYVSEDFQSDETGGYPTCLNVNWEKGVAWLSLSDGVDVDLTIDVSKYQQMCADFGIRTCTTIGDYNNLLSILGEDAEETAYIDPLVKIIDI